MMRSIACTTVVGVLIAARAVSAQTNIDPINKWAWGENIGWTNWHDAGGGADGVFVGSTFLSGHIWSENAGWVSVGNVPIDGETYANADGTDYGVNIDLTGDLNGYAWGENIGWISFGWADGADPNRPRFDETAGRFRGWVWSESRGWINLDDDEHYVASIAGPLIPTLSEWGESILAVLLVTIGTIVVRRRRRVAT